MRVKFVQPISSAARAVSQERRRGALGAAGEREVRVVDAKFHAEASTRRRRYEPGRGALQDLCRVLGGA